MKSMKKLTILLLILSVLLVPLFTACGNSKANGDEELEDETAVVKEDTPVVHKVGFIYRETIKDSVHNAIWESARVQVERNLGVETCYVENVLVVNFREAVDLLVDDGATVIVSTSDSFAKSLETVSMHYRDINFISFGGESTRINLTTFSPLLYQPANVNGLVAALNSRTGSVGVVADSRMFNCAGIINAYIEGARLGFGPHFSVYVNYAMSGNKEDIERAIDDLVSKGNDTIMLYLSTDYGIKYCEEIGVRVIAYSPNLPELAPNTYMTGFFFNVDSYITEQVRFIQNESLLPSNTRGDMASGHVRPIQLNPNEQIVSYETKSLADVLYLAVKNNDGVFKGEIVDNQGQVQVRHGVTLTYREVFKIEWLDFSVGNRVGRFSEPIDELRFVPLIVVQGDYVAPIIPVEDDDEDEAETTATTTTADNITSAELETTAEIADTTNAVNAETTVTVAETDLER